MRPLMLEHVDAPAASVSSQTHTPSELNLLTSFHPWEVEWDTISLWLKVITSTSTSLPHTKAYKNASRQVHWPTATSIKHTHTKHTHTHTNIHTHTFTLLASNYSYSPIRTASWKGTKKWRIIREGGNDLALDNTDSPKTKKPHDSDNQK